MSTTNVPASFILDRVANLLNDPNKTDYTYTVMIPYLNMAIDEISESTEETNNSPSIRVLSIDIPTGEQFISSVDNPGSIIHYPVDLTEIQEIRERTNGSNSSFNLLPRKEVIQICPQTNSLLYWVWSNQVIAFNPGGANTPMQIQLTYIAQAVPYVATETDAIAMINSRSFLTYKTAALCALFIGENESRAQTLDDLADKAMERTTTISNKGRQQIMTRHRPFRAGYKMRGWF